jgi:hypothetical protein
LLAGGELVAALWKRATASAEASLAALREELEAVRRAAEGAVFAVRAELERAEAALEQRTSTLLTAQGAHPGGRAGDGRGRGGPGGAGD